jgi:hypothetical protein
MTISKAASIPVTLSVALTIACDTPSEPALTEVPDTPRLASPTLGKAAFLTDCAGCHAARDGFDLAFFSFPDSTIVRRAVAHVDTLTARDIVAYIETLNVEPVERHAKSFQPGGVEVAGDVAFALALFGSDAWPVELSTEAMAAIDPTEVRVAFSFPTWSSEVSNLDWMPDERLPDRMLGFREGAVGRALDMYYRTGSEESLLQAVVGIRTADRQASGAAAPCVVQDEARFRPQECFEVRRWTSSLVAQHMLRTGRTGPMHPALHDSWWDVGNAARKSIQHGVPIANAEKN